MAVLMEILLPIVGVLVVIGAGYALVRPRDEEDVAVLESPSRRPRRTED